MPSEAAVRWGFCWLEGTISEQMCHHCQITGVALLVEATPEDTLVTLLCEDHKLQYRRLWRALAPQSEMSDAEAERLAR